MTAAAQGSPCRNRVGHPGCVSRHPPRSAPASSAPHPSTIRALVITDEASPFALRSTRNHPRRALHPSCQSLLVQRTQDDGAEAFASETIRQGLARYLPETTQRVASRRPTANLSTAALTCAVVWARKVLRGLVNHPHINGMQGVRGSNPLSSTPGQRPNPAWTVPESPAPGSRSAAIAVAQADPSTTGAPHRRFRLASSRGLTLVRSPGASEEQVRWDSKPRPRARATEVRSGKALRPAISSYPS